jgi:hypothetical protein
MGKACIYSRGNGDCPRLCYRAYHVHDLQAIRGARPTEALGRFGRWAVCQQSTSVPLSVGKHLLVYFYLL